MRVENMHALGKWKSAAIIVLISASILHQFTMNSITYEHLFQWAFALSPFPSYLPQYISIIKLDLLR